MDSIQTHHAHLLMRKSILSPHPDAANENVKSSSILSTPYSPLPPLPTPIDDSPNEFSFSLQIYSLMLYLIHAIWRTSLKIYEFLSFTYNSVISALFQDRFYHHLHHLINPPANIGFCLDDAVVDFDYISDLIFWCKQVSDIRSVTFFRPFQSDFNANVQQFDSFLAKLSSSSLQVSFLSFPSGRDSLVKAAKYLAFSKSSSSNNSTIPKAITSEQISDYLRNHYPAQDPDMLIVLGSSSLNAYPPWQLRLTEIIFHRSCWKLTLSQFYDSLKTYSKCEQRFGK